MPDDPVRPESGSIPGNRDSELRRALRKQLQDMFRNLDLISDEIGVISEAARSEGQPEIANVLGYCVSNRLFMNLVWEAPALPLGLDPADIAPLWAHCMAVAHIATVIAANVPSAPFEPEVAHLVAMIHDIGYLLQLNYSPNTWEDIRVRLEREECDTDNTPHEYQGEELAKFWSLPVAAVAAIRSHHEPHRCQDARARWLSTVIATSEGLLRRTSDPVKIVAGDWPAEALRKELRLPRELLARLRTEGLQVWDECLRFALGPSTARLVSRLPLLHTEGKDE